MELTRFILAVLISSLGIPAGILIAHFTQAEWSDGAKYFYGLQRVILLAVLALCWSIVSVPEFVLLAVLTLILLLPVRKVPLYLSRLQTSPVPFVMLALVLFRAQDAPSFPLLASLAFLYGIPAGTLIVTRHRRWYVALPWRVVLMVGFALLFQLLA
jgi:hypothetical protein